MMLPILISASVAPTSYFFCALAGAVARTRPRATHTMKRRPCTPFDILPSEHLFGRRGRPATSNARTRDERAPGSNGFGGAAWRRDLPPCGPKERVAHELVWRFRNSHHIDGGLQRISES